MWMTNTRLLTLVVILLLVVTHYVGATLTLDATPVASTVQAVVPAESWSRPTLFELMDPATDSEAPPVVVRETPTDQPTEEGL